MNTHRLMSVAIGLAVIVAIGTSAATLESTMETDPGDAIEPDYDTLPVGQEQADQLQQIATQVEGEYEQSQTQSRESQSSESASSGASGASSSRAAGTGAIPTHPGFPWATLVAALLILVAGLWLLYRHRQRLWALFATLEDSVSLADRQQSPECVPNPENDVQRAWVELLSRAGVSDPQTRTPAECARIAIDRGFDPDRVTRLRRLFEDVEYGQSGVSEEHGRRARETIRQLGRRPQ